MTIELFREDAYARDCRARVVAADGGGVVLDRTVFYATGGGQPGDSGELRRPNGSCVVIGETRKNHGSSEIVHLAVPDAPLPSAGEELEAVIDWERRLRLMRTHSALHLLCRAVDGAVTGGSVGELKGRLDFDIPDPTIDKDALADQLNAWVAEDRPIRHFWIEEEEFDRRPELVRTMSVAPPRGAGRVRLVEIEGVDLQACGGTHVRGTGEIGRIAIAKIEKKGRQNRRVSLTIEP